MIKYGGAILILKHHNSFKNINIIIVDQYIDNMRIPEKLKAQIQSLEQQSHLSYRTGQLSPKKRQNKLIKPAILAICLILYILIILSGSRQRAASILPQDFVEENNLKKYTYQNQSNIKTREKESKEIRPNDFIILNKTQMDLQVEERKKVPLGDFLKLHQQIIANNRSLKKLLETIQHKDRLLNELKLIQSSILQAKQSATGEAPEEIFELTRQFKRAKEIRHQLDILQRYVREVKKTQEMEIKYQYFRQNYAVYDPVNLINKVPVQPQPLYTPSQEQLLNYDRKKDFIIYTPAGRKPYLQVLYYYLKKQRQFFFEWHLWENTVYPPYLQFIKSLAQQNDWIKIISLPYYARNPIENIFRFWLFDKQQNKIYMKLDDDIIWMSEDFVDKMFKARIQNPKPMLIFSNIINNQIIGYLHQRAGNFIFSNHTLMKYYGGANLWQNSSLAKQVHQQFLESAENNQTQKWKKSFHEWYFLNYERVSINSVIYFGNAIRSLGETIKGIIDDQQLFSTDFPHYFQTKNVVINDPICVHEAYSTQRQLLEREMPGLLKRYRKLAGL